MFLSSLRILDELVSVHLVRQDLLERWNLCAAHVDYVDWAGAATGQFIRTRLVQLAGLLSTV